MHCWLRAIPSVWLLFVLCATVPKLARTPFMHEWVNEGQKNRERSRPAEDQAGDRLL